MMSETIPAAALRERQIALYQLGIALDIMLPAPGAPTPSPTLGRLQADSVVRALVDARRCLQAADASLHAQAEPPAPTGDRALRDAAIDRFMDGPVRHWSGWKGPCNCLNFASCGYCAIEAGVRELLKALPALPGAAETDCGCRDANSCTHTGVGLCDFHATERIPR